MPPKAKILRQFSAMLSGDTVQSHITGIAVVQNLLLLADNHNHQIKAFDVDTYEVKFRAAVDCAFDITKIDDTTIVVTCGNARYFAFYTVTESGLTEIKKINTQLKCWGVCNFNNYLYIVFQEIVKSKAEVDVFSLDGYLIQRFEPESEGEELLRGPFYITIHRPSKRLYVGNWLGGVIGLSLEGEVEANCSPDSLKNVTGVAVDEDGRLYVCGVNSHNVVRVSADGTDCQSLVTKDIQKPQCVYLIDKDTMVVCCEQSDIVRVYVIS